MDPPLKLLADSAKQDLPQALGPEALTYRLLIQTMLDWVPSAPPARFSLRLLPLAPSSPPASRSAEHLLYLNAAKMLPFQFEGA